METPPHAPFTDYHAALYLSTILYNLNQLLMQPEALKKRVRLS